MDRKPLLLVITFFFGLALGQSDFPMPGVNVSRDSHVEDVGAFKPPFQSSNRIQLQNMGASGLYSIDRRILVKRGGGYDLYLQDGPQGQPRLLWSKASLPQPCPPAFSRGVVLLQSATTTSVQAVRIDDGQKLWDGEGVGEVVYAPLATGNLAVFHGPQRLIAARLDTGTTLWEYEPAVGLANTPVSLSGDLLFVMDKAGFLHAFSISSGEEIWSVDVQGRDGSWTIATPETVFVSTGAIFALDTATGSIRWQQTLTYQIPQIAWAKGLLYVTYPGPGWAGDGSHPDTHVVALRGESGVVVWDFAEEADYGPPSIGGFPVGPPLGSVITDFFIVDGTVYFYNSSLHRIRALNAGTGSLLWSEAAESSSIVVSNYQLALLRPDHIQMYLPAHRLYLPQFAFGDGYSLRVTVNNPHDVPFSASVAFYNSSGEQVTLPGNEGNTNMVDVPLPPLSSATILIPDTGETLQSGWTLVEAPVPVTANLVYQYTSSSNGLREVGIADSPPTDFAQVKISHGAGFSTAVALVVLSNRRAVITYRLLDEQGEELAVSGYAMEAHEQTAKFFNELFYPLLDPDAFEGTLVISSDQPISVTALRTKDGTPLSAVPVGRRTDH